MAISIVKTASKIETLIAGIATKSGAFKEHVSSVALSTVAHSIEHGDYSLINSALESLHTVSYRDQVVFVTFLNGITPFVCQKDETVKGRKEVWKVVGRMAKVYEPRKDGESEKDFDKRKEQAKTRDANRCDLFAKFAAGEGVPVKNLEFVSKAETPDVSKTVLVAYAKNIFAWFEDVEYARKKSGDDNSAPVNNAVTAFDGILSKLSSVIKAENVTKYGLNADDVAAIQAAYDIINKRLTDIKPAVEAASNESEDLKALTAVGATDEQIAAWKTQRAKRHAENVTPEAIRAELTQYCERLAKKAA